MIRSKKTKLALYALLIVLSCFCLFPFLWLIRSSLMQMSQIYETPPVWIPSPFQFGNYSEALTVLPFGRYFLNTSLIVVLEVTGVVLTSAVCAYAFARLRWPGRNVVFMIILTSMMLPGAVTLIPVFLGWSSLGAVNTIVPLTVPAWFGGGAFNVFLIRQFLLTIPKDLDEAALVDGAGYIRIFTHIMFPLAKPALIVVGLFSFLNGWNDFLGPLIYLNDEAKFTLALGLQLFKGMYNAQWHLMMAATTMVVLPAIVVFFLGQKYFVEGIVMSGVKG
ncbi:carbohydrate ABC transporter permease [Paenibacillus arenilitoris]|uniref:Carbohydrate ABC transporter permease n=1 Tax=Paenibacillus arenilitoris TaxID=2772299 RepID=A0A927CU95_9BACL|nr:carbohydrate ABC transporter permease [Paenibacillus arenilitoris]MBD2871675.1 carbohydrate ABC transporter permease [Paenibacillus arenilitoris]